MKYLLFKQLVVVDLLFDTYISSFKLTNQYAMLFNDVGLAKITPLAK